MLKRLKYLPVILSTLFILSCNNRSSVKRSDYNVPQKEITDTSTSKEESKPVKYGLGELVTNGLLDRDGNMWFTTNKDGIYKYDGKTFRNFTEKDGLFSNDVWSAMQDKDGVLWFGTAKGLCSYNGIKFVNLPLPQVDPANVSPITAYASNSTNVVTSIIQDRKGHFWIGTDACGVYHYDGETFTLHLQFEGKLQQPKNVYNNSIRNIMEDRDGNIWFSSLTHGGITRHNPLAPLTNDKRDFINYTEEDGLCDDMVFTSFQDSKGNIWIGVIEDGDLCCYNENEFIHYTETDGTCFNFVSCFYEDKSSKIWFGSETEEGLCIFDGEGFFPFSVEGSEKLPRVRFIVDDAKGNMWIGGRNGGLWRFDGNKLEDFTQAKNES